MTSSLLSPSEPPVTILSEDPLEGGGGEGGKNPCQEPVKFPTVFPKAYSCVPRAGMRQPEASVWLVTREPLSHFGSGGLERS